MWTLLGLLPWGLIGQLGIWLLDTVIKDKARKERMKASFERFVANRQVRANQTVELKDNLDEQSSDLDQKQKELEHPTPIKPEEKP